MNATPFTANALRVLQARYLRRDCEGAVVESPAELLVRVAQAIAAAEAGYGTQDAAEAEFHQIMRTLEFFPNSPTLMNAGTERGQLSACFVLPVEDSIESIFEALKRMAIIQNTGGGTGFSFSRLRPRGDFVEPSGGEAGGPVAFLKVFDAATEHVKQGGRRRGANMGVLRVDHPDIVEFISVKSDGRSVRNFNLSVGITDQFMSAVASGAHHELVHPRTGAVTSRVAARELFDAITSSAWRTGDPGLVFLDAINRSQPTPALGNIECTNPCGEVPLLPNEACNLGSINLARMVRHEGGQPHVDWTRLRTVTRIATRFLDDVIDAGHFTFPEMECMVRGNRKIGLGVMGFADLLVALEMSYDSDEAVVLAGELMKFINDTAHEASGQLAAQRGVFPNWSRSRLAAVGHELRNATCTAIAPTGTIGIIADASPGIEPLFALAFRRTGVLDAATLTEVHPALEQALKSCGADGTRILHEVMEHGTLAPIQGVPEKLRRVFITAHEIPPERHLQIQAAFQRHVDNAVSKTINLPFHATVQDIARICMRAWELDLKGITVFRDRCLPQQVIEPGIRAHAARCDPGECEL